MKTLSSYSMQVSWMNPKLQVKETIECNNGVFATEKIIAGERLTIFGGEVMLIDEIHNLLPHLQYYPLQIEERFVLGMRHATQAEPTDFFNHSCEPNTGVKGQIFLVAMRDIFPGEEIVFDYAMVISKSEGSEIKFEMECKCNTASCRKLITEDDWRRSDLRKKYHGYFSTYLEDKIANELNMKVLNAQCV